MEADASTLDMPSDCCYFVEKAAAAGAAPAFQYFDSIFHHFAVVTQNLGQTHENIQFLYALLFKDVINGISRRCFSAVYEHIVAIALHQCRISLPNIDKPNAE